MPIQLHKRLLSFSILILTLISLVGSSYALGPGSFVTKGPATAKKIALTFDDGPGPQTEQFLELLQRYHVKATFFMLAEQVGYKKAVAKKIADAGFEVGSHTTSHRNYAQYAKEKGQGQAKADLIKDMKGARKTIEEATGVTLKILRMPHGIDRPWIKEAAKETGFVLVNWTYGSDWIKMPEEEQTKEYIKALQPGAIILLHDGNPHREKSLRITEALIKAAQEKGYEMVTVGELIGVK
jgi:peptidoglycan/xylan/chitin deacetylase (PgdA/CDA1 family)